MAKYVVLNNTSNIEAKYVVDENFIIDKINTVEIFDIFRELSFTTSNVEYEIYNIVSYDDYFSLWMMDNHYKHKDELNSMIKEKLDNLSLGNGNICHACLIEIYKDGNPYFSGFANRGLFSSIEEKYLEDYAKKLTR